MNTFIIRQHSTSPALEAVITKDGTAYQNGGSCVGSCSTSDDPNALDLTGATVTFEMKTCGRTSLAASAMGTVTVVDAVKGLVSYQWHANDTLVAGTRYATFVVTFSNNTVYRWPNYKDDFIVEVTE